MLEVELQSFADYYRGYCVKLLECLKVFNYDIYNFNSTKDFSWLVIVRLEIFIGNPHI